MQQVNWHGKLAEFAVRRNSVHLRGMQFDLLQQQLMERLTVMQKLVQHCAACRTELGRSIIGNRSFPEHLAHDFARYRHVLRRDEALQMRVINDLDTKLMRSKPNDRAGR